MIGLKRGTVALLPHEKEWEDEAARTIAQLKQILGDDAVDIRHVGSTSIKSIKAKPIIDIAVGVRSFDPAMKYRDALEENRFYYRNSDIPGQLLFACGNYYEGTGELQTHFIHVVIYNGKAWNDYINFTDFLNSDISAAKEYETLKLKLAAECPVDPGREKYLAGKHDFINRILRVASCRAALGRTVKVTVDRPLGSVHPHYKDTVYPVNYGYTDVALAADGEEQDVYILGVNVPVKEFEGVVKVAVCRLNDVEDKWVAAPEHYPLTKDEIIEATRFQEQYFDVEIIM